MKNSPHQISLLVLLLFGVSAACNMLSNIIQPPETATPTNTATPTPTVSPTSSATPTPTVSPTETATAVPSATMIVTPPTATPIYAPYCDETFALAAQCQIPIAEQSSVFCENKSPYNLILINEGATYEVLHEHIQCSTVDVQNGKQRLTCTGPMALYFELKVCDSACNAPLSSTGQTNCPHNYSYNEFQGCCSQETQEIEAGCTVLKLNTKSCVINCAEFTSSSTCTNYGYACRWNDASSECQLRK